MAWVLTKQDLVPIALGAAVLGTGGGGDPYIGRLVAEGALGDGQVTVLAVDDVADDAWVIPIAAMGAPTVLLEKVPAGPEPVIAVKRLEEALGIRATAVCAMEAGGVNSMVPLATAAQLGVPVVDADGMGRAFPEVYMETFHIYGLSGTPACLVNEWGDVVTFQTHHNQALEHYARAVTIRMGGHAFLSHFAMQGRDLHRTAVRGTLGFAKRLGEALMEARRVRRDPLEALVNEARRPPYRGAAIRFTGKIVDVWRRTTGGFARGRVVIEGADAYRGVRMAIEFQNENLVALIGDTPVATAPDLITVLDRDTALPITTEYLHYGQRVAVLVIAAPTIMTTPEALAVWGPSAFGYPYPYQPPELEAGAAGRRND
jgi:DUF917 family protein